MGLVLFEGHVAIGPRFSVKVRVACNFQVLIISSYIAVACHFEGLATLDSARMPLEELYYVVQRNI